MLVNDKGLERQLKNGRIVKVRPVDVRDTDCIGKKCYWPRPDPGSFTQGVGYSQRTEGNAGWLCGTRECRGCPE